MGMRTPSVYPITGFAPVPFFRQLAFFDQQRQGTPQIGARARPFHRSALAKPRARRGGRFGGQILELLHSVGRRTAPSAGARVRPAASTDARRAPALRLGDELGE